MKQEKNFKEKKKECRISFNIQEKKRVELKILRSLEECSKFPTR